MDINVHESRQQSYELFQERAIGCNEKGENYNDFYEKMRRVSNSLQSVAFCGCNDLKVLVNIVCQPL